MSEALCQCGHAEGLHGICHFDHNECLCGCRQFTPPPTREADQKDIANALVGRDPLVAHVLATHMQEGSPEIDPTREPIRLTDEAEAAASEAWSRMGVEFVKGTRDIANLPDWGQFAPAFIAGFRAARLAGGPTLADARTPESEDTE